MSNSGEHNLDELIRKRDTRDSILRLDGKVDAAHKHAILVSERVSVVERELEGLAEDIREIKQDQKSVLTTVGQLSERSRIAQALSGARDAVVMLSLGAIGLWAALEMLRGL